VLNDETWLKYYKQHYLMQTIAEIFKILLWNSYRPCTSQHVASVESLITLLTL